MRTPYPAFCQPSNENRSSALIIVLFMVVIVSFILVAFMGSSSLDLASSHSFSQGISAEQIGLSGLSQVVADLKQEIITNSTATTVGTTTIYTPKYTTNAEPEISLAGNTVSSAPTLVTNLVMNLVKISSYTAPPYAQGTNFASSINSTTNQSFNGRYISASRWNKPALIQGAWPSSATLQTPDWINVTRSGAAPQTEPLAEAKDASLSNTNYVVGRYAYAVYDEGGMLDVNVAGYPSSGSDLTAALIGKKGNEALADLTQIGLTQSQVDALVKWRNAYSIATSYTNYVTITGATNGFLNVQGSATSSDNTFLSRQDLINYATANGLTGVLPYLSTFTREENSPSWYPTQDAGQMTDASGTVSGNNGSGTPAPYAYFSNKEVSAATNRDIPNVRVATSFTRLPIGGIGVGETAVVGEPLVKRRFPLSRLALLNIASPTTAQTKQIQQYFGLVPDAASTSTAPIWDYDNPNGTSPASGILTLGQVAALTGTSAREPDFFELLQASILSGSLGLSPGNYSAAGHIGPANDVSGICVNSDAQVLQIGVNIIDQYRSGNYPLDIYAAIFTSAVTADSTSYDTYNHFYGVKNLPYFQRIILMMTYDPPGSNATNASGENGWWIHELSYPNQYPAATPGPTAFRIQGYGGRSELIDNGHVLPSGAPFSNLGNPVDFGSGGPDSGNANACATLTPPSGTANNFFTMPRYMSSAAGAVGLSTPTTAGGSTGISPLNTSGSMTGTAADIPVGIWGGWIAYDPSIGNGTTGGYSAFNLGPESKLSFALQYQDSSNPTVWHTYSTWKEINQSLNVGDYATVTSFLSGSWNFFVRCDPLTDRFGSSNSYPNYSGTYGEGKLLAGAFKYYLQSFSTAPSLATADPNLRPDHYQGNVIDQCPPNPANGFTYMTSYNTTGKGTGYCPGLFADNIVVRTNHPMTATSGNDVNAYYADPDGIVRRASGAYSDANPSSASAMTSPYSDGFALMPAGNAPTSGGGTGRPIVLSRAFRSVAEMGFAGRDVPFKSLDFFTQESADAALLDVFSLDDVELAAGKINPNTRNIPALQAIIAGAFKAENDSTLTIAATEAQAVATALAKRTQTRTTPSATTDGPLVNRSELVTKFSNDLSTALSVSGGLYNKTQREAVVRALADVSNTRTWNLMVDVIAQSGRYPTTANGLGDFVVEGERRYWLHVAIDRYTGKIIDQQLEAVHE